MREKWREHGVIGFVFACHWLKNWREILKPVTNCSNPNRVIIWNTHLKIALSATLNLANMLAQSHPRGLRAKGGRKSLETKLVNGILPFRDRAIFFVRSQLIGSSFCSAVRRPSSIFPSGSIRFFFRSVSNKQQTDTYWKLYPTRSAARVVKGTIFVFFSSMTRSYY